MQYCMNRSSSNDSSADNFHPRGLDCILLGAILLQYLLIVLILAAVLLRCCVIARRKRKKRMNRLSQNLVDGVPVDYAATYGVRTGANIKESPLNDGYSLVKLKNISNSADITDQSPGSSPGYSKLTSVATTNDFVYSPVEKSRRDKDDAHIADTLVQTKPARSSVLPSNETILELNEGTIGGDVNTNKASLQCPATITMDTQFNGSCVDSDSMYSMAGHGGMSSDNLTDGGGESDAHYSVISRPSSVASSDSIYDNLDKDLEQTPADYEDFYSIPTNDDDDTKVGVAEEKTHSKVKVHSEDYCDVDVDGSKRGKRVKIRVEQSQPHLLKPPVNVRPGNLSAAARVRPRSVSANCSIESAGSNMTTTKSFNRGKPIKNNPYVNV